MRKNIEFLIKIVLLLFIWWIWWWALNASLSKAVNLAIIFGGVILMFPLVWLGRLILDRHHTSSAVAWITTFIHWGIGITFGVAFVRAVVTHQDWNIWVLPVPEGVGSVFVIITGLAFLLAVLNLALKGLGAPFYIALSQKVAVDWMYAWTRNPMLLAAFAFFLSLGLWFQSAMFVLWVLILVIPAFLFFVKVFEEKELEHRFGSSYLDYKSKTPMLFPKKPAS